MKIMFKFLLVMILFNISSILVAASGFFGENVLYGDIVSDDPNEIISIENVMDNLFRKVDGSLPSIDIPVLSKIIGVIEFSWATITVSIFAFAIAVGIITKSTPTVIPAALVGSIFLLMWVNSKDVFDEMVAGLDNLVLYIVLMIGVGFFFVALIAIMDYLSGQQSG